MCIWSLFRLYLNNYFLARAISGCIWPSFIFIWLVSGCEPFFAVFGLFLAVSALILLVSGLFPDVSGLFLLYMICLFFWPRFSCTWPVSCCPCLLPAVSELYLPSITMPCHVYITVVPLCCSGVPTKQ